MREKGIELGPDVELVLEPMLSSDGSEIACGYYFVCHENRSLFWLENFDPSSLFGEVKATSPAHFKLEMEAQYWSVYLSLTSS